MFCRYYVCPAPLRASPTRHWLPRIVYWVAAMAAGAQATGARWGAEVWRFPSQGTIRFAPAVGPDGRIVFSSEKTLFVYSSTGTKLWEATLAEGEVASSPMIAPNGRVYLASNRRTGPSLVLHNGQLTCWNADGTLGWSFDLDVPVSATPAVDAEGNVYIPTWNDAPNARPASTGIYRLTLKGEPIWFCPIGAGVSGSPAVQPDGAVFCAGRDGLGYAISPDGSVRWKYPLQHGWSSGPIIVEDGLILFESSNGLVALNQDGSEHWQYRSSAGPATAVAVSADGTLIVATRDARTVALDLTGKVRWERSIAISSGAALTNWRLVVRSGFGVHEIDGSRFDRQFALRSELATEPVVSRDGIVFFGGADGYLYGLEGESSLAETVWPLAGANLENQHRSNVSLARPGRPTDLFASQGTLLISVELGWSSVPRAQYYEIWRSTNALFSSAVRIRANFTGAASYQDRSAEPEIPYTYWLQAFNSAGGSEISPSNIGFRAAAAPGDLMEVWNFNLGPGSSAATAPDGTIYFGAGRRQIGSVELPSSYLAAFNADGSARWETAIDAPVVGSPAVREDGVVCFATSNGKIYALNADGTVRWSYFAPAAIRAPIAVTKSKGVIFGTINDRSLYALDRNGLLEWRLRVGGDIVNAPVVGADGAIYFYSDDYNLYALNPDGSSRWTLNSRLLGLSYGSALAIGSDGTIYWGSGRGTVVALNMDGAVRWTAPIGASLIGAPVVGPEEVIYVGSAEGVLCAINPDGTLKWKVTAPAVVSAPAIAADGTSVWSGRDGIVFALDSTGAVRWQREINRPCSTPVLIAPNGRIYAVADSGGVWTFFGNSPPASSAWPMAGGNTSRTGRSESQLSTPTRSSNIRASLGTFHDKVELAWASIPGAYAYQIWRATNGEPASASLLASNVTTRTDFIDRTAATGVLYYYWITASNIVPVSDWGAPVQGWRREARPGELIAEYFGRRNLYSFAITADGDLLLANAGKLTALSDELKVKWERPLSNAVNQISIGPSGQIIAQSYPGKLHSFHPDGTPQWELMITNVEYLGAVAIDIDCR